MSLISFRFFLFLLAATLFYYSFPEKNRWKSLLVISCLFYVIVSPFLWIFIVYSIISSFVISCKMETIYEQAEKRNIIQKSTSRKIDLNKLERKKVLLLLLLAIVTNFGILFLIKYIKLDIIANFGVPLGISYYTFQTMSYVIDVYRKKTHAERNLFKYSLFVLFFPQLIQGPISRFDEIATQFSKKITFSFQSVWFGIELIVWGIFKKIVIGDRLHIIASTIFSNNEIYDGLYLWLAAFFSMIELYADFSGGIDIARGIAQIFGINLPDNFIRPFFAKTINEFWRRWHITLNNWWRDYIFYPITLTKLFNQIGKKSKKIFGKNIGKKIPVIISLILVRIVNSIWHGVTPCSLICGLYYGITLALSFLFEEKINYLTKKLSINTNCCSWRVFQCVRTFILISAPRVILYANSVNEGWNTLKKSFKFNPWILFDGSIYKLGVSEPQFRVTMYSILFLLCISYLQERGNNIRQIIAEQNIVARGIIYICVFYFIILFGVYGSGYDITTFTYAQF